MLFLHTASAAGLFDKQEYAGRRNRLMERIPDGAAVFLGAETSSGDVDFRQGHDFAYFTGVEIPGAFLIIDGVRKEDVMGTFAGPDEVLAPGFVFACDIQLFRIEEEIGIRIEDTIAITEDGYENLSLGAPRTVAEIEVLMKRDGILQVLEDKGLGGSERRP